MVSSFSLTIKEFNFVPPLHRSTGKTFVIKLKTLCNKLTANSLMAESVHRDPWNIGTTLESRIIQNSSKDSWLNCSASVTISSSSSSLPWEPLLSDRLELDWSSLKANKHTTFKCLLSSSEKRTILVCDLDNSDLWFSLTLVTQLSLVQCFGWESVKMGL